MIKKIFITVILSACCNLSIFAADSKATYKERIYNLFINNKVSSWDSIILEMERDSSCQNIESKMELLGYYYGYIGHLLDKKQKDKADDYIDMCEDLMDDIDGKPNHQLALYKGYKANVTGFKIALSPIKATVLARGMLNNSKSADKLNDGSDPTINILVGNISYYMPEMFGGDKNLSLKLYRKSLDEFNANPKLKDNNWMYLQLLVTIGLTEETLGNYEAAKEIYEESMQLFPTYNHVKEHRYPILLEKMNKK